MSYTMYYNRIFDSNIHNSSRFAFVKVIGVMCQEQILTFPYLKWTVVTAFIVSNLQRCNHGKEITGKVII